MVYERHTAFTMSVFRMFPSLGSPNRQEFSADGSKRDMGTPSVRLYVSVTVSPSGAPGYEAWYVSWTVKGRSSCRDIVTSVPPEKGPVELSSAMCPAGGPAAKEKNVKQPEPWAVCTGAALQRTPSFENVTWLVWLEPLCGVKIGRAHV